MISCALRSVSTQRRAVRSLRQLQASSGLLFDVLQRHDPGHVLLAQAEREVLESQLEVRRLAAALERCRARRLDLRQRHPGRAHGLRRLQAQERR